MTHQTGKVRMCPFIPADQFIRECQSGHETPLLQPEDGGEGAREEDAFDTCERDQADSEGLSQSAWIAHNLPRQAHQFWRYVLQCPVCLLPHAGDWRVSCILPLVRGEQLTSLHSSEEEALLLLVSDIRLDQERVRLRVYLLDHALEGVEGAGFRELDV